MKSITGLTIILVAFLSCKKKEIKINPTKENITESVYASGIIKSINQYQVYAPVNGLIKNIFVKEGDKVKKDETIVQIMGETARLNTVSAEIAANNNTISNNADKLNELQSNINFLIGVAFTSVMWFEVYKTGLSIVKKQSVLSV